MWSCSQFESACLPARITYGDCVPWRPGRPESEGNAPTLCEPPRPGASASRPASAHAQAVALSGALMARTLMSGMFGRIAFAVFEQLLLHVAESRPARLPVDRKSTRLNSSH